MENRYKKIYENLPWHMINSIQPHLENGAAYISISLDTLDDEVIEEIIDGICYHGGSNTMIPNDDRKVIFKLD